MYTFTPVWVVWLVSALATWRLARLVTMDVITEPLRVAVIRFAYWAARRHGARAEAAFNISPDDYARVDEVAPRLAVLVTCVACASVWTGAAVYAFAVHAPQVWLPVAGVLALSGFSLIAEAVTDR